VGITATLGFTSDPLLNYLEHDNIVIQGYLIYPKFEFYVYINVNVKEISTKMEKAPLAVSVRNKLLK
jgi:hypothetical protein